MHGANLAYWMGGHWGVELGCWSGMWCVKVRVEHWVKGQVAGWWDGKTGIELLGLLSVAW